MNLFGSDPHFLGEELSDLMSNEGVVHPNGTSAGAATAEGAAVGQLGQPGDGGPVQFNVSSEFGRDFSPGTLGIPYTDAGRPRTGR